MSAAQLLWRLAAVLWRPGRVVAFVLDGRGVPHLALADGSVWRRAFDQATTEPDWERVMPPLRRSARQRGARAPNPYELMTRISVAEERAMRRASYERRG